MNLGLFFGHTCGTRETAGQPHAKKVKALFHHLPTIKNQKWTEFSLKSAASGRGQLRVAFQIHKARNNPT